MSIKALNWAYKQSRGLNSTSKFVLTALADYANEDNCAYPSIDTLSTKTLLDRKTVVLSLQRLVYHEFIQDTGSRKGKTGQVKVYYLSVESIPNTDALKSPSIPNTDALKSPKNGVVEAPKDTSKSPENGGLKESQKRDTEPSVRITLESIKIEKLSAVIEELSADPRYDGLDVDAEIKRAVVWCKKKNVGVSRRRLRYWLDNAERDLEQDDDEELYHEDPYYSWDGWTEERRRALLELWPKVAQPPVRWDKVTPSLKELIDARVKEGWS